MEPKELINSKQQLIEKIINDPLKFTDEDFLKLVNIGKNDVQCQKEVELNFDDLRKMIIRIFDINEETLKEESDATKGILGYLNKRSTKLREKRFKRLIDNGFRRSDCKERKVVVAEGDSWFQFPLFIKDIIDWLRKEPDFAVFSMAYGGDWFTNILYDQKYIEALSIYNPEVFLLSGGGNDFIGSSRLAVMVNPKGDCQEFERDEFHKKLLNAESAVKEELRTGYKYIQPVFYSFIWTIKAQYWILLNNLLNVSTLYKDMQVITQGYDYVIPTFRRRTKKWYYLQPLVNAAIGSGQWLQRPLKIRGIHDEKISRCILKALIFELNCMFIDLAEKKDENGAYYFKNLYHIDCRGTALTENDWWDEIHLHSEGFRKIAKAYKYCMENKPQEKVIKVQNMPALSKFQVHTEKHLSAVPNW